MKVILSNDIVFSPENDLEYSFSENVTEDLTAAQAYIHFNNDTFHQLPETPLASCVIDHNRNDSVIDITAIDVRMSEGMSLEFTGCDKGKRLTFLLPEKFTILYCRILRGGNFQTINRPPTISHTSRL